MLKNTCGIVFAAGLSLCCAEAKAGETLSPSILKQLLATERLSRVELSPNKKHLILLYERPYVSPSAPEGTSKWSSKLIIKRDYESALPQNITFPDTQDILWPRWIQNSQWISYIGQGEKTLSLWINPTHEINPRKILELEDPIVGYGWSPDGEKLAVFVKTRSHSDSLKMDYKLNTPQLFKIYVFNVHKNLKLSKPIFISTPLSFTDINEKSFSWSPDSQHIMISHIPLKGDSSSKFSQLSLISLTKKQIKPILSGHGDYLSPSFSPDGTFAAYTTNDISENTQYPIRLYGMDSTRICLKDLKSDLKRCLTNTPNESPTLVGWEKEGRSLLAVDREGNADHIYELGISENKVKRVTEGEASLTNILLNSSSDVLSYVKGDLKTPSEGYLASLDPFQPQKVVSSPPLFFKQDFNVATVQWRSKDNKFTLEGLFISPKTTQKSSLMPLVTILPDYSSLTSPLEYVGNLVGVPLSYGSLLDKGYALFIPNRRGSNGYGVQFRQAIFKELGQGDFEDAISGIDHVVEQKNIDPHQLALWGWGYGGYVAAWALTQTDRFKTIIVGGGISNLISHRGTTLKDQLIESVMGGPFWENWNLWRERTPLSNIEKAKTPTLIQHGEADTTVDHLQSEELYFPLKSRHIPVQMVTYKTQDHVFFNPYLTLLAIQDLQVWLENHLSAFSKVLGDKKERAHAL